MSQHRVLGIFAHPDDETIMAGGTLALLHAHAIDTYIVSATRGEGGEAGEPPVVADRAELGAAREAELRCAAEALGITTLTFLGYIDPDVGPEDEVKAFTAEYETLVAQITAIISESKADIVLSHGPDGEYGHPAHKLVYRATHEAVTRSGLPVAHYSVAASVPGGPEDHIWNESRIAHLALDISPWADHKLAAMECHVSQHALFKRRRQLTHIREGLRRTESFFREYPAVNGTAPDDWFADLLRAAGARGFNPA